MENKPTRRGRGEQGKNLLGCSSLMATVGSALDFKLRLTLSSAVSVTGAATMGGLLPDELDWCDLDDLLPKLKPRWCLGPTMAPVGLYTASAVV